MHIKAVFCNFFSVVVEETFASPTNSACIPQQLKNCWEKHIHGWMKIDNSFDLFLLKCCCCVNVFTNRVPSSLDMPDRYFLCMFIRAMFSSFSSLFCKLTSTCFIHIHFIQDIHKHFEHWRIINVYFFYVINSFLKSQKSISVWSIFRMHTCDLPLF